MQLIAGTVSVRVKTVRGVACSKLYNIYLSIIKLYNIHICIIINYCIDYAVDGLGEGEDGSPVPNNMI